MQAEAMQLTHSLSVERDKPRVRIRVVYRRQPVLQRQTNRPIEVFANLRLGPLGCGNNVHSLIHEDARWLAIFPSENLAPVPLDLVVFGGRWKDAAFFHDLQNARGHPFGVSVYPTERDWAAFEERGRV